ncbi:aromatic ring-opening dioxygenase LigA [Burkholderia multivorans]|nr:aromatic ring-opening dioxygenase LigA [Burkholderia multivorans]
MPRRRELTTSPRPHAARAGRQPSAIRCARNAHLHVARAMLECAAHWGVAAPLDPPHRCVDRDGGVRQQTWPFGHGGRSHRGLARPMVHGAPHQGPARGGSSLARITRPVEPRT